MKFAEIAVPVPVYQTYTYLIPSDLEATICPGYRVIVPLGKRKITGYVVSLMNESDRTDLKPVYDLLDESPALLPDLLMLAKWISEYYICPLGEVIKAMLPGGINLESNFLIRLLKDHQEIQKYIEGEALYIPKGNVRKKWGENSGGRKFFLQRNEEIRNKFFHKVPIEELAEEYCLSYETIKKIVYK